MRDVFDEILRTWGAKHWSFGVRKNPELMAWIADQTQDLPETVSFGERAYCAITGERAPCPRGSLRKFKSVVDGWTFCGRTGKCECAREQVSQSVSQTKQAATTDERAATQAKREATNLERYGHVNSAQTVEARIAHQAFYADTENVRNQLRKQVATMMERYGVENAAHIDEAAERKRQTIRERYGVGNPMQNKGIAAKSLATRLAQGYSEDYYLRNYNRLKDRILADWGLLLLTPFEAYEGVADSPWLSLQCVTCHRQLQWRLVYNRTPHCPICRPGSMDSKSQEEIALFKFIKEKLAIADLISGDRQLIFPLEIDILSESHRVAIEYGGLYWHSEWRRPDHLYHLTKLRAVESIGFRLLTIFGDEWLDHPDIVKSKICHLFGRIEDRRYARKMRLVEVDSVAANAFYEASHIQGATNAGHHLALLDGEQVMAVMSFSRTRASQRLPDGYELNRFATAPYMTVVGGASRLFSHFIRSHRPAAVVSYADRRWSAGGLYRTLGFTLEHTNPPGYSYVEDYMKRHFRFNFRKDVLESILGETDESEWTIMKALGYDRIWDCGTYRFVWSN
jgi:hypothetical protein